MIKIPVSTKRAHVFPIAVLSIVMLVLGIFMRYTYHTLILEPRALADWLWQGSFQSSYFHRSCCDAPKLKQAAREWYLNQIEQDLSGADDHSLRYQHYAYALLPEIDQLIEDPLLMQDWVSSRLKAAADTYKVAQYHYVWSAPLSRQMQIGTECLLLKTKQNRWVLVSIAQCL